MRPVLSKIDFGRASQFTSLKPVLSLKHFLLNRSRYCTQYPTRLFRYWSDLKYSSMYIALIVVFKWFEFSQVVEREKILFFFFFSERR